jgi:anti-anti-sigma factor
MEPVVVVFAGEYNVGSKQRLHREFSRLATKPRLVLDFSEVTYMDSTCIAELMRMEQRRNAAGFETASVVMKTPVLIRIFTVLTLDRVFRVVPTVADAIGSDLESVQVEYAFCGDDGVAKVPQDYERVHAIG